MRGLEHVDRCPLYISWRTNAPTLEERAYQVLIDGLAVIQSLVTLIGEP
jgi:hypothetical protein